MSRANVNVIVNLPLAPVVATDTTLFEVQNREVLAMANARVGAVGAINSRDVEGRRTGWLATASVAGAFLASSCCIVPLALVMLGVSGAWIGNLTALAPYKPWFVAGTLLLLSLGFWHVYFRAKPACADGSYCARPQSALVTKTALWLATVLVLFAATISYWAPYLY
jgi:mercuric ion transport protein